MSTPAGTLRVDLQIDGSRVPKDVAAAVDRGIKPAMAEAAKAVGRFDSALNSVGDAGFRDVIAGASRAEKAIEAATRSLGDLNQAAGAPGNFRLPDFGDAFKGVKTAGLSAGSDAALGIIEGMAPRLAALGSAGGPIGVALAGVAALGVGAGALLGKSIMSGLDQLQGRANVAAALGLTPAQMKPIADASAQAYAKNFGGSVAANMDIAKAAIQSGLIDPTASKGQIEAVVEQLSTVSTVMAEDIPATARAAEQAIRTGLVGNAVEAFDLMTRAQQAGLNVSQDLLDTFSEYGTQFRKLGLTGTEAFGLINQAVKGGARDGDIAADALKEFSIRAIDGSKSTMGAFKDLGLNFEETTAAFAKGGDTAKATFGEVLKRIAAVEDPVQRAAIGVALFGTQAEDLGGALGSMNLDTAVAQFGRVEGAAQRAADTMGGTAASSIESARRSIEVSMNGVAAALGEGFGPPLQQIADWVSSHQADITGFFVDLGQAAVTGAEFVIHAAGQIAGGLGELIAPIGDALGALNKFEAWQADLRGDHDTANQLRDEAEAFFSWGDGLKDFAETAKSFSADSINATLQKVADDARTAEANVALLGRGITTLPDGTVVLNDTTPEAIKRVEDLGYAVTHLPDGQLSIQVQYVYNGQPIDRSQLVTPPRGAAFPGDRPPTIGGGRADGGVLPGYSPGFDDLLVPMSGGEGILIPEAVRALGPNFVYSINAMFRPGLPKGFAGGGINGPGIPSGLSPLAADVAAGVAAAVAPMVGLLAEIRDLGAPRGAGGGSAGTAIFAGSDRLTSAPVSGSKLNAAIQIAQRAARSGGYSFGGVGGKDGTLYDCSGLMSDIFAALTGKPYQGSERYFTTTSDFPSLGFVPGFDPASPFNIGVNPQPGRSGHMVGQLGGINVEAGGAGSGITVGAGATDPRSMPLQFHLPADTLGVLDGLSTSLDAFTRPTAAGGSTSLSYKDFAYGDPRRMLAGVLGGIGVSGEDIGALMGGVGGPLGSLAGDVAATVGGFPLPLGFQGTPTAASTDLNMLADQGNPLFLAQAAGVNVPDYTRMGGGVSAQNLTLSGGLPNDATGRIYSDTAALIDRTFTNMDAADKARHDQVMAVLNEVRDRLSKDILGPVVRDSVTGGIDGMGSGTSEAIGAAMGNAAGPVIASAVASAGGGGSAGAGASMVNTAAQAAAAAGQATMSVNSGGFHSFDFGGYDGFAPLPIGMGPLGNLYDQGGLWPHGTFGTNLSGAPERVLDPDQTRLFDAGLLGGWNLQPLQQQFAATGAGVNGGVDVSATVGAEWTGLSQVPILSTIVNLLVAVLLKVIGVQVQSRDTLNEISSEFRDYRGDFRAFDAAGRVMNDTSGLVDRSSTSEQAAVDERVRILKQVLEGLLNFLIEKIIVPIGKAVANTAINIGAQAANGAITGGITAAMPAGGSVVGGMVGSMVSSAISSAGSASVDIIAEVGTILSESLISVGLDAITSLFTSYLPDAASMLFSGGIAAAVFDPIGQLVTGALGGVAGALSGVFGGLASLIPGLPFDDGGIAVGMGLLPKATIAPERVLSPRQTDLYDRHVRSLEQATPAASVTRNVNVGDIHMHGTGATPEAVRDRLLALIS